MTGTASTEAEEFSEIYDIEVLEVPTNKSAIRSDYPDCIYITAQEKYQAIKSEIKEIHSQGRPILVGTSSIESSEKLACLLVDDNFDCQVLNAKYHEKEQVFYGSIQMNRYNKVCVIL